LISDELFAQSVFPTRRNQNPRPFISVLSLPEWSLDSDLLDRIHVLGSVTKDLGLSGLKAAILVIENESVRKCVEYNLGATPISGLSDAAISHILTDDRRVDKLLARNSRLLGKAMDLCADWAEFHEFPYVVDRRRLMNSIVEANAGCYFIIDFGRLVPGFGLPDSASTLEGEIAIMKCMISSGVHIVSQAF
jgi:bifunctional pyridoxal-dependent enzyme with beta-cystathionase and maltose regulon repressor activities